MSRVLKNAIIWVLVLVVILCIIAGFTFGLSSVSGVADAADGTTSLVTSSVNGGVVRSNFLRDSTASGIYDEIVSSGEYWYARVPVADMGDLVLNLTDDGYLHAGSTNPEYRSSANIYCKINLQPSHAMGFTLSVRGIRRGTSGYPFVGFTCLFYDKEGVQKPESNYVDIANLSDGTTFIASLDFTFNDSSKAILDRFYIQVNDYFDIDYIKLELYELDEEPGFTGFVPYSEGTYDDGYNAGYDEGHNAGYDEGYNAGVTDGTQAGYDEGYEVGYDEGYNTGISDGLISANQIFNCSAFNIKWDSVNEYAYPSNETASVNLYQNIPFTEMPVGVCVPLSKIAPDNEAGGYLPIDLLPHTEDSSNNPADSIYALRFPTLLDLGQWLLDNPNDYLVSWTITGEADPACIVFSDLSNLSKFMSGAGENYLIGYDDGYNDGYDDGDGAGYNRGYGVGFNKGQADATGGNYTFLALIGSVLDAPISAFKGLLDFELLGVNMSSFVLAIMSLCVIIVIIRVVLR